MSDSHFADNDLFVEGQEPMVGRVKQLGIAPRMSETPGVIRRATPLLGQHTAEILQELGYPQEKVDDLLERRVAIQAKLEEVGGQ